MVLLYSGTVIVSGGQSQAVAYFSETGTLFRCIYCVTRRELVSVILSVSHFRSY